MNSDYLSEMLFSLSLQLFGIVVFFTRYRNPRHTRKQKAGVLFLCIISGVLSILWCYLLSYDPSQDRKRIEYKPEKREKQQPPEGVKSAGGLGIREQWEYCIYKLALEKPVLARSLKFYCNTTMIGKEVYLQPHGAINRQIISEGIETINLFAEKYAPAVGMIGINAP